MVETMYQVNSEALIPILIYYISSSVFMEYDNPALIREIRELPTYDDK